MNQKDKKYLRGIRAYHRLLKYKTRDHVDCQLIMVDVAEGINQLHKAKDQEQRLFRKNRQYRMRDKLCEDCKRYTYLDDALYWYSTHQMSLEFLKECIRIDEENN